MRIPEGKIIIRNAWEEFASPENIMAYLGKKGFTGYMCAQHGAQRDYILLRGGKVFASLESIGPNFRLTPSSKIIERAHRGGEVFVGELSKDMCGTTEIVLHQKRIFENLKSDFTRLRPFLITMQSDGVSGVVEIAGSRNYGCILLEEGIPQNAFVFREGYYREGAEALSGILHDINSEIHTISVYEKKEGSLLQE